MNEVLHANVFFFITGIAVIVFTALLCVALFHGIKVLKSLRRIMERIEMGTEVIAEDMQSVRAYFSGDGLIRRLIIKFMGKSHTKDEDESKAKQKDKRKGELKIKDEA